MKNVNKHIKTSSQKMMSSHVAFVFLIKGATTISNTFVQTKRATKAKSSTKTRPTYWSILSTHTADMPNTSNHLSMCVNISISSVIYATKIDGNDALNVSLTIDRSNSISESDMSKIKNATNIFLSIFPMFIFFSFL